MVRPADRVPVAAALLRPRHDRGLRQGMSPAEPDDWWRTAVVYQVYPRSFADSDGDGVGDLRGHHRPPRLPGRLGVDVVWLSPVYPSPQDDNGYDISDYQDVDPLFGTLADLDELIAALHERGHASWSWTSWSTTPPTSTRGSSSPGRRATTRSGTGTGGARRARASPPATPGAEPTNWESFFSGPAWELRRGDRRVLPAPVLPQAARPELGEPRGPRRPSTR